MRSRERGHDRERRGQRGRKRKEGRGYKMLLLVDERSLLLSIGAPKEKHNMGT